MLERAELHTIIPEKYVYSSHRSWRLTDIIYKIIILKLLQQILYKSLIIFTRAKTRQNR